MDNGTKHRILWSTIGILLAVCSLFVSQLSVPVHSTPQHTAKMSSQGGAWRVCIGQLEGGSKEDRDELRSEMQRTISRLGGKVVGTVGLDRNRGSCPCPQEEKVLLWGSGISHKRSQMS